MDVQHILASLAALHLDELRQVQARVNELIAQLEAQHEPPAGEASYQAYRDMKAHAPEDLGKK